MKKLLLLLTTMTVSVLLTACGGGGGGGTSGTSGTSGGDAGTVTYKTIPLNVGEKTPVKPGYSIVDSSEDAVLDVLVVEDTRTVTLTKGSASLKMPN